MEFKAQAARPNKEERHKEDLAEVNTTPEDTFDYVSPGKSLHSIDEEEIERRLEGLSFQVRLVWLTKFLAARVYTSQTQL